MKSLILFMLLPVMLFAQQLSHSWGQTTAGVAYTQTGTSSLDSSSTTNIVFDMQDYYFVDYFPAIYDSATALLNSNRMYYGTFWYKIDLQNATDSSSVLIQAFPGFMDYYPGSGDRLATANIDYSTTATTLQDSGTFTTNDVQWTAVNVYISDGEGKILPPEFIKIKVSWGNATEDSVSFYHDFVHPTVPEDQQAKRTTTNPANAKKAAETLH